MSNYYVYIHRRLSDNLPFYVGKGKNKRAWNFNGRSRFWQNIKNKHGIIVEIVFDGLTEEEAFECEKDTILEFRYFGYPLVNLTDGGEGFSGYVQSIEHKAKAAQSRASSKKWLDGVKKTALKLTGRLLSEVHRQNISKANTGRKLSESTKKKLSDAKKNCPEAQQHILDLVEKQQDKNVYCFYHLDGTVFTGTRVEFSRKFGIETKTLAKLFQTKNPRKSVKNWSLSPILMRSPKLKNKTRSKRGNNLDKRIHTFYHVLGETFTGTRFDFSEHYSIPLERIAALFCKNPRRSVYGWSLQKIAVPEYTHLKL